MVHEPFPVRRAESQVLGVEAGVPVGPWDDEVSWEEVLVLGVDVIVAVVVCEVGRLSFRYVVEVSLHGSTVETSLQGSTVSFCRCSTWLDAFRTVLESSAVAETLLD